MFIAPLRHAILHLARTGRPFTFEAIGVIGTASPSQVKRYVNILANEGVLSVLVDRRLRPGVGFDAWAAREPKTKPGGHRRLLYRAVPREVAC